MLWILKYYLKAYLKTLKTDLEKLQYKRKKVVRIPIIVDYSGHNIMY